MNIQILGTNDYFDSIYMYILCYFNFKILHNHPKMYILYVMLYFYYNLFNMLN